VRTYWVQEVRSNESKSPFLAYYDTAEGRPANHKGDLPLQGAGLQLILSQCMFAVTVRCAYSCVRLHRHSAHRLVCVCSCAGGYTGAQELRQADILHLRERGGGQKMARRHSQGVCEEPCDSLVYTYMQAARWGF
jgi:hypothetical protein